MAETDRSVAVIVQPFIGERPNGIGLLADSGSGESWFEPRRGNYNARRYFDSVGRRYVRPDCYGFCYGLAPLSVVRRFAEFGGIGHDREQRHLIRLLLALLERGDVAPAASLHHVLHGQMLPRSRPRASIRVEVTTVERREPGQSLGAVQQLLGSVARPRAAAALRGE